LNALSPLCRAWPPHVHRLQLQPFSSAQHVCNLPGLRPLADAAHSLLKPYTLDPKPG
jgi:hypothetical protein